MSSAVRCVLALILCVAGAARAHAADDGLLFRVFLTDGSSIVTYGEFARVGDQVVLSVPVGGTQKEPRLQAVSLTASQGNTLTHLLAAAFFAVSITFVYRSFYGMRIRSS